MGISYVVSGNSGVSINNDGQVTATEVGNFKITVSVHGKKIKTISMKAISFTGFADAEVCADYAMDVTGADEIGVLFADKFSVNYDDVKVSSKNSKIAKAERKEADGKDIDDYMCDGIYVTGIKEGTTTISVTVSGVTKEIKVIVGDGYEKLSPVEAIQKNDFTGYTGNKLATLQKTKQIIDEYNLMSSYVSDRDKIVAIQTFLNSNINKNLVIGDEIYNGDISCVLLEGYGYYCCGWYAETFCFLCDCINIPCYYCGGAADNGDGTGFAGHAWNKVEVDGKWYYIDVYWNACLNNFDYFLTEKLWSNHELDELQEIDENGDGVVDEDERENFEMTANDVQQEGYYKDMCGNPGEVPYLNDLN